MITVRPADLLEPIYEILKEEAEGMALIKKEEDVLTYILYPAIAPAFLRGEKAAEPIPVPKMEASGSVDFPHAMEVEVDGEIFSVRIVSVEGSALSAPVGSAVKSQIPRGDLPGGIKSNMQGMVLDIKVSLGQEVKRGDTLVILEAMKMENPIHCPIDGKVKEIFVDAGAVVQNGDILLVVQ